MIRNIDFLKQPVDFAGLPSYGQDIDYFTDFNNEVFVAADFKYGDACLTQGQRQTAYNLVDTIGTTSPVFFAVVNHDYAAPETVDASWASVREVLYSWPSLHGVGSIVYDPDEAMPFSRWIATISVVYFLHHKLTRKAREEIWWYDTLFCDDAVFSKAWDSPEAQTLREQHCAKHLQFKRSKPIHQPDLMLLLMDKSSAEWAAYYDNALDFMVREAVATGQLKGDRFFYYLLEDDEMSQQAV